MTPIATLRHVNGITVRVLELDPARDFPFAVERRERHGGRWFRVDAFASQELAVACAAKLFAGLA